MSEKKLWRTSISSSDQENVYIAGYKVSDMMRNLDFAAGLFVLYQQRIPSAEESKLLNAVLIAPVDHGIVVPSAISRMIAASGVPLQASVAAGITSFGDVHGGAGEQTAKNLQDSVAAAASQGISIAEYARLVVENARANKERIEGYGHPLHPGRDARVDAMVGMAKELGLLGAHLELSLAIESEIERQSGHRIPLNIDGAMAGILMDLGFDWRLTRVFVFLPRAAGIAAHAVEEVVREKGWRIAARPDDVEYDGPPKREFPVSAAAS